MAAFAPENGNHKCTTDISRQKCDEEYISRLQEIITPSIVDLTKEVRTNILCTVEGCGKILPNTPALNMHLVKSHRVKDGLVNPTIRKDMAASQRLYCCPIEGCPRGPNRPFSQFSLVKQHFMKMHAEKKHKCSKCNNGYSTEWDLRRHMEDCGKTYCCTCGCPYASRAALLSHIYRTGHEVPTEHRIPPVKKRKMERLLSGSTKGKPKETRGSTSAYVELSGSSLPFSIKSRLPETTPPSPSSHRNLQKLLLPKPKMALVNVPVMHLAHVPVLLPSTDGGALRSVVLAVDSHGSLGTLHLLPQALGAVVSQPDAEALGFKDCRAGPVPVSTGVQVSLEEHPGGQRGRSTSTDIQTDVSCLSRGPAGVAVCAEPSASACSQTDISVSAQVLLPVSVETQTTTTSSPRAKATSTIAAQTDGLRLSPMPSASSPSFASADPYVTRHTQTASEERSQMDRAVMCSQLFDGDSLSVSTQTAMAIDDPGGLYGDEEDEEEKAAVGMCFGVQTDELSSSGVADNQTQTMTLLSDLENILSGHQVLGDPSAGLGSAQDQDQHAGIDFDLEEFLNTVHIQTQTEESELGGLGASLDIQTQTDFLLLDELNQSAGQTRAQATDLELEMFDTQTQTDLNFLLSAGSHMPLGSILRHSSFSMSTESSDTETQTDVPSLPLNLAAQPPVAQSEQARPLSSTETQTMSSQPESLGHLFLTSNETQTAVDDFLSADLAWNMESQLSSVETQTCEELCALFQHSEKPNS